MMIGDGDGDDDDDDDDDNDNGTCNCHTKLCLHIQDFRITRSLTGSAAWQQFTCVSLLVFMTFAIDATQALKSP